MEDKQFNNLKYYYTIIYLDLYQKLRLKPKEYIVLSHIVYTSKRNECKNNVTKFSKQLCISRNTIYNILEKLWAERHIKDYHKESKILCLDVDLKNMFDEQREQTRYCKVYHKHKKELKISELDYILLFSIYILSKKCSFSNAGSNYFINILGIKERNYYLRKERLSKLGLIRQESYRTYISKEIEEWFDLINKCSNAA